MALPAQGRRHYYLIIHGASATPLRRGALQSRAKLRAPSDAMHQAVGQIKSGLVSHTAHTPDLRSSTVAIDDDGRLVSVE